MLGAETIGRALGMGDRHGRSAEWSAESGKLTELTSFLLPVTIGYMKHTADTETLASEYLANNIELREALEIPPEATINVRRLGMGEHNLNFWFTHPATHEKQVLRINVTKQPFHANQVRYEFEALQALEQSGCTPKPLYLDDSLSAPCEGAMVISFCDGDQLDFDHLKPGDLQRAACLMAHIHAVPVSEDSSLYRPENPIRTLFDECLGRYRMYRDSDIAQPRVTRMMERFISVTEQAVDDVTFNPAEARIVNTETLASHFLLPRETIDAAKNPGFFVDWERPILGDTAEDVAFFVAPTTTFWDSKVLFPTDRIHALVETYWDAVDKRFERGNFDARFQAFLKVAMLRALTWCCRAEVQKQTKLEIHITDKALAKVPIYLSDDFMNYLAKEGFGL